MGDSAILVATLAVVGAVAAGATALSRPHFTLGILFLLASLSRATLETPLGTMRLEMPAIAAVTIVLLLAGRFQTVKNVSPMTWWTGIAFGIYLLTIGLSSALIAPDKAQSLHMVAWLAISMLGGVISFVLMSHRPVRSIPPLAYVGGVMGAIGIAVAVMFFVAGPRFDLGIQDPNSVLPRVYAMGWEANLYASFLGMCAFFAIELARGGRSLREFVPLVLILIGLPLGITRGAYVGLAAGFLAYLIVRLVADRRSAGLARLSALVLGLLIVGFAASNFLLPNAVERHVADGEFEATPSQTPSAGGPIPSSIVSSSPDEGIPVDAPPLSSSLEPYPDTLAFRLERVPVALADFPKSPLVGFGAESFGQLHPDRYAGSGPDHIAIMAVVVPYEAGVIGASGLFLGFALLLGSLWKVASNSAANASFNHSSLAAAFIGSLVVLLVAYQVTNALHLAINWIVIGSAAALGSRASSSSASSG